jgi:WD40 repeat protein
MELDVDSHPISWASMPTEILVVIFSFLDEVRLRNCSIVCFHWANCARIPRLWLGILSRTFPDACKLRKRGISDWFSVASIVKGVEANWKAHRHSSHEIAFQPSGGVIDFLVLGKEVVSCGLRKTLAVTNVGSQERTDLLGHEHHVCALTICAGGSLLAASSYDSTISLWDSRLWQRSGLLAGHTGPVLDCRNVFGGGRLVSRGRDGENKNSDFSFLFQNDEHGGTIRLWDLEKTTCSSVFRGHNNSCTAIKVLDANRAVSSGRDGVVAVWDFRQSKPTFSMAIHDFDM